MNRIVVPPTLDICRYKCKAHVFGSSVSAFKYLLSLLFSSTTFDSSLSSLSSSSSLVDVPSSPRWLTAASISACASGGGRTASASSTQNDDKSDKREQQSQQKRKRRRGRRIRAIIVFVFIVRARFSCEGEELEKRKVDIFIARDSAQKRREKKTT